MDNVYRDPTPDQLQDLHDSVVDAVTTLTDAISVPYGGLPESDPRWGVCMNTPEWQMAMLRALRELEPLTARLGERVARTAGVLGATYTQLGDASGITRQAATKRWPGAVPPGTPHPSTSRSREGPAGSSTTSRAGHGAGSPKTSPGPGPNPASPVTPPASPPPPRPAPFWPPVQRPPNPGPLEPRTRRPPDVWAREEEGRRGRTAGGRPCVR